MTKLLAQAFEKAAVLPEALRDQLARELLEEIEWESRWDATLAGSQDKLERLAERAAEEYRLGTRSSSSEAFRCASFLM